MTLFLTLLVTSATSASCGSNSGPSPSASASASASAPPLRQPRSSHTGPSNTSAPAGPREPCGEYDTEGCQALCVKGVGRACHNAAASLVAQGDEQEKRAVDLFEEGCRLGDVESCRKGATRLGTTPDMHRDAFLRARNLLDKGCEIGSAPACKDAHRALIGIDKERAKKAYARLCALDPSEPACAAADDALLDRAEKARASCEKGEPAGCVELGHALRGLDEPRRIDAYKRACLLKGHEQPASIRRECIQSLRELGERQAKSEAAPPPASAKKPAAK